MFKPVSAATALPWLAITVTTALPTIAYAANGPYYRAELSSPAPKGKFVARGVVWSCDGTSCDGARGTSRPLIMCASLVREVGELKSFTANGKSLEADELARCNGVS